MEKKPTLSSITIVVPCYNPPPEWEHNLLALFSTYQQKSKAKSVKLTLVNDGSTNNIDDDKTTFLKKAIPSLQLISYAQNKGKGFALRAGLDATEDELYIITDIDFPYTIDSMIEIEQALLKGADVAVGYRDTDYYENVPWFRRQLSKLLRFMVNKVFRLVSTDTQCGLKGFNSSGKASFLKCTIDRFLFDLEFLLIVSRSKKLSIQKVTVQLKEGVIFNKVNFKIIATELINFARIFFRRI